jgi:thiol-disulfide isomerase/thioredoxin
MRTSKTCFKVLFVLALASGWVLGLGAESPAPPDSKVAAFKVADLDGRIVDWQAIKSARFEGQVLLLDFWATWCFPCRETMPQLQAIQDRFAGQGDFNVVGFALERNVNPGQRARLFAEKVGVKYPLFLDVKGEGPSKAYGVTGVPDLFLIDDAGRILGRWSGSEADFDDVEKTIKSVLDLKRQKAG